MTNSEILAYTGSQLSGLDKQRQFVLRQLTRQMGCPNCATVQTYVQAAGLTVDTLDLNKASDDPCKCSGCGRGLKYTVPMMGDCYWTLIPVAPTKAAHTGLVEALQTLIADCDVEPKRIPMVMAALTLARGAA